MNKSSLQFVILCTVSSLVGNLSCTPAPREKPGDPTIEIMKRERQMIEKEIKETQEKIASLLSQMIRAIEEDKIDADEEVVKVRDTIEDVQKLRAKVQEKLRKSLGGPLT